MAFALVAAFGFTACHDDDEEDENSATVSNYNQSAIMGASMLNNLSSKAGVTTCYFTDESQIADFYTFSTETVDVISEHGTLTGSTLSMDKEGLAFYGDEAWYGGFCPTWFAPDDEEQTLVPACHSYHGSNTGALICNPGTACRTMFSRHMSADLTSVMAAIKKLKISSLWVCPVEAYSYIGKSDDEEGLGSFYELPALPANHEIQFVVYGYVEHCSLSNFQEAIKTLKDAGSSVAAGGKMCETPVVLASTDADGKLTVNAEWQKLDLSSIKDCYLLEAAIRVVEVDPTTGTGKTSQKFSIDDQENGFLNYVLISDVAFTGRSFF